MNIPALLGSHVEHDRFIKDYLAGRIQIKVVKTAILNILLHFATSTRSLYTKARELFCAAITEVEHLAVYLFLKHYPIGWRSLYKNAYILLCDLLTTIKTKALSTVFPPKWTEKIFQMENLLLPSEVKAIMFGIDPIPLLGGYGSNATGLAFCFSAPAVGPRASSSIGLNDVYGLNLNLCHSNDCKDFVERNGVALVNFIRMIPLKVGVVPVAGSRNIFLPAWTKYNRAWLLHNNTINNHPKVLIFENEEHKFDDYASDQLNQLQLQVDFTAVKNLLTGAVKCSHPSYCSVPANGVHCLGYPNVQYTVRDGNNRQYDAALLLSLPIFTTYIDAINASEDCVRCLSCEDVELAREAADEARDAKIAARDCKGFVEMDAASAAVHRNKIIAELAKIKPISKKSLRYKEGISIIDKLLQEWKDARECATEASEAIDAAEVAREVAEAAEQAKMRIAGHINVSPAHLVDCVRYATVAQTQADRAGEHAEAAVKAEKAAFKLYKTVIKAIEEQEGDLVGSMTGLKL